jgi:4-alpha-glucanotransferase
VPTGEVWDGLRAAGLKEDEVKKETDFIFNKVLERIGKEELWLFKDNFKGEKDLIELFWTQKMREESYNVLKKLFNNRLLFEYEPDNFVSTWYYKTSRAWASMSDAEKAELGELFEKKAVDSEKIWEKEGKKLLDFLCKTSPMLPCAEDLGDVPACVPKVLGQLKILGLRVVRWTREYAKPGEPYIPFDAYPELSVCTPAVHDCSTLREWWEKEANQDEFCRFIGVPSLPHVYNPGAAKIILQKMAGAASRYRVFQIQDLLHLSPRWYAPDCSTERINVPGTHNLFNWTYRLPATVETIADDPILCEAVRDLSIIKPKKTRK